MSLVTKIKDNPRAKKQALKLLIPAGEARPRKWVSLFVNPFFHKKGKKAKIRSSVRMDVLPFHQFVLGDGAVIEDFSVVNNGMGDVIIGNHSFIGLSNVMIGPVEIGRSVIFAQHVVVSGLNHGYSDPEIPIKDQPCTTQPIRIEDACWIGANAVITAGVTIGKHSVIAAGSVVTKSIPPYSVAVGNPARVIKRYNFKEARWEKLQN